ncbi:DUF397 domain-containing protein [Micromonospora sp. NPDC049282]
MAVRDSKARAAGTLVYPADGWTNFVAAVEASQFDPTF